LSYGRANAIFLDVQNHSSRYAESPWVSSLSPPSLFVAELAEVLFQRAKSLFHANALAISSSSSDPLKAKKTIH